MIELISAAHVATIDTYGPDRVFGFSPIPAMSMLSYAAGARYLQLMGGVCGSFYDWYCDLPPASPQTWGEQTDVSESADWYNSGFLLLWAMGPCWQRWLAQPRLAGAVAGINAAVVGLLLAALYQPVWQSAVQASIDLALAAVGFYLLRVQKLPILALASLLVGAALLQA